MKQDKKRRRLAKGKYTLPPRSTVIEKMKTISRKLYPTCPGCYSPGVLQLRQCSNCDAYGCKECVIQCNACDIVLCAGCNTVQPGTTRYVLCAACLEDGDILPEFRSLLSSEDSNM